MDGVRTFLESSSIHGLTHISTSRKFAKVFWITIVFGGFTFAGYMINNSIKSWESSQDNETYGEVTPLNNYSIKEKECRDFKKIIRKAGEIYEEVSTACRNEQGDWILI